MKKVEVDLDRYNQDVHVKAMEYTDGSQGIGTPPDFPFYVRAYRLDEGGALKGWVVQLDAIIFGVKVLIRQDHFGNLKVYEQTGDDKPVKMEEWERAGD